MFSLFSKQNKKETVLIFDIGSASVAGALVEISREKEPTIIYTKRLPIKFQKNLSSSRFKKEMFTALDNVSRDLLMKGLFLAQGDGKKISRALCSLSSPWFVSETKTVKINQEKPFEITNSFLKDELDKEILLLEKSDLAKYNSQKIQDSEIIEKIVVDIKLNGYKIENPIGKKAKSVELSFFISMSQESILDGIEELISKNFHLKEILFHSFTLVSFTAIRDMYDRVSSFLMIDITGEVTDVTLVKKQNLIKTVSFPFGTHSMLRDISDGLKIDSGEALSAFKLFSANSLNKTKTKEIVLILEKSKKDWLQELGVALNKISGRMSLPTTVFFTADDDFSSWYGEIIKLEDYAQHSISEGAFIVSFMSSSNLSSYVTFKEKVKKDVFLGLESLYIDKLFEIES